MDTGATNHITGELDRLTMHEKYRGHDQIYTAANGGGMEISHWYVSVVSIIFDCSMPILFNFHIFLVTFYIIFGTNRLIQCPVTVLVCCMFYVSQKPHIKRSPKGIKTDGEYFWNICDFWEEESTRDGARGGHEAGGRAPDPRGHPIRRLVPFFRRNKANI